MRRRRKTSSAPVLPGTLITGCLHRKTSPPCSGTKLCTRLSVGCAAGLLAWLLSVRPAGEPFQRRIRSLSCTSYGLAWSREVMRPAIAGAGPRISGGLHRGPAGPRRTGRPGVAVTTPRGCGRWPRHLSRGSRLPPASASWPAPPTPPTLGGGKTRLEAFRQAGRCAPEVRALPCAGRRLSEASGAVRAAHAAGGPIPLSGFWWPAPTTQMAHPASLLQLQDLSRPSPATLR